MPWAPITHQQAIRKQRRGGLTPTPKNYHDPAWEELRRRVLIRDPVCLNCHKQRSSRADHIVPVSRGGKDELSNLQGMCESCHNSKTATEGGGFQQRWEWNK